jgi:hypothetical protein
LNSAAIVFDYNDPVITNTTISTVIDTATGIYDLKNPMTAIYPNPAANTIILNTTMSLRNSELQVCDVYGNRVPVNRVSSNVLDIYMLSSGMYIVKILGTDKRIQVFKFVKQ